MGGKQNDLIIFQDKVRDASFSLSGKRSFTPGRLQDGLEEQVRNCFLSSGLKQKTLPVLMPAAFFIGQVCITELP
jgi:hypothetical protein